MLDISKQYNIYIDIEKDEHLEKALRRFRRKCKRSGLMKEMKFKSRFISKSQKRNYIKNKRKFQQKIEKKYGSMDVE